MEDALVSCLAAMKVKIWSSSEVSIVDDVGEDVLLGLGILLHQISLCSVEDILA